MWYNYLRNGGEDMAYDFDQLNWISGYFDDQFTNNNLDGFNEIVLTYQKMYGLEDMDSQKALALLKERFQKAYWRVLLVPDFGLDEVSQTFRSEPLFKRIFTLFPSLMPLLCPNQPQEPVLQTNRLYQPYEDLIYHLKELPLVYVFNDKEHYYLKVDSRLDLLDILGSLNNGFSPANLMHHMETMEMAYFIQLSDFHFGSSKKEIYSTVLISMLDEQVKKLNSRYQLKFLITGDLMHSPSRKNMYQASEFLNELKRRYHSDVQFVLGNHDMVVQGLNIFRRQKAKVVAYILAENIHVLEDIKVVLIKLNSSLHGNFARGMIGERQLLEIDDELTTIENLDSYTPFVMVHHHLIPVQKAEFLKTSWREKSIVGRMVERSKTLVDSDLVLEWMKRRHIHYAFHGHQHIPALNKVDDTYIIGSGSSTGVMKDDSDRYLSYNLIQYDVSKKRIVSCTLFYEDERRQLPKHIYTQVFKEEKTK